MKLITIVDARASLQKLVGQDLPLPAAWAVMQLADACNVHLNFYGTERGKLGPDPDPEKLAELHDLEVGSPAAEKIRIALADNVRLSAVDLKALEPFVDFYQN